MTQDKFILNIGAQVGGCLVDGLGDGVMVQAPGLAKDMLRSVCFGLLQVKFVCHSSSRYTRNSTRAGLVKSNQYLTCQHLDEI